MRGRCLRWVILDQIGLSAPCPVYPRLATGERTLLEVRFVPNNGLMQRSIFDEVRCNA